MSMLRLKTDVHVGHIIGMFTAIERFDPRPVMRKKILPLMRADQKHHKMSMSGPRMKWPRLAASTRERRKRLGILRNRKLLARLPLAWRSRINRKEAVISSRVRWSMAHQDGPTRVGNGAKLPQRQYYWLSRRVEIKATAEFAMALMRNWATGKSV